jgi:hypothetical protein
VLGEVTIIVKDRVAQRRRLFYHPHSSLSRVHQDKTDLPKLHRRVDEVVQRFQVRARIACIEVLGAECCQVATLIRNEAALAKANTHISHIAQHLQSDAEDRRQDANNGTLLDYYADAHMF